MPIALEDRLAITELISLHGHLVDDGRLGSSGSVTYLDTVVRTEGGWRISHRAVSPRRTPLGGLLDSA